MWIDRDISARIAAVASRRPCVLVTGCRQTGKTSLIRRLFPNAGYLTLYLPAVAAQAEEAGEALLSSHPPPLVLDEVPYAPALFRHLKVAIDRDRDRPGQYLLTGSQLFPLMAHASESLAGRVGIVELHPLSLAELEGAFDRPAEGEQLLRWIHQGGFPEIHARGIPAEEFYADYVATYLERDVRQVLAVRNLRDFDRFLRLVAIRSGQLLHIGSFASDLGISPNTAKSWLSVLETSGILAIVEPYFENLGKRLVKSPKLYMMDTGLACFLAGLRTPDALRQSALLGAFFETHVYTQLRRQLAARGQRTPVWFFRDHSGTEVDFVLAEGAKLRLIEVKWSENPSVPVPAFRKIEEATGLERILSRTVITPRRGSWMKGGVQISDSVDWSWLAG